MACFADTPLSDVELVRSIIYVGAAPSNRPREMSVGCRSIIALPDANRQRRRSRPMCQKETPQRPPASTT